MWALPEAPDVLESLAAFLGGAAAFYGVYVAHQGLSTWKREKEYELAGKVAAAVFSYRKSLHFVRFPYLTAQDSEVLIGALELTQVTDELRLARWRASRKNREALAALIAEANIRWKGDAQPCFEEIVNFEERFAVKIGAYARLNRRMAVDRQALSREEITEEEWEKKFDSLSKEREHIELIVSGVASDNFGQEIDRAFRSVETLLRSKS